MRLDPRIDSYFGPDNRLGSDSVQRGKFSDILRLGRDWLYNASTSTVFRVQTVNSVGDDQLYLGVWSRVLMSQLSLIDKAMETMRAIGRTVALATVAQHLWLTWHGVHDTSTLWVLTWQNKIPSSTIVLSHSNAHTVLSVLCLLSICLLSQVPRRIGSADFHRTLRKGMSNTVSYDTRIVAGLLGAKARVEQSPKRNQSGPTPRTLQIRI